MLEKMTHPKKSHFNINGLNNSYTVPPLQSFMHNDLIFSHSKPKLQQIETHLGSRFEQRFIIQDRDQYIKFLKQKGFSEKQYSGNGNVITVYLNNPVQPLSWDFSIKVRQYVSSKPSSLTINPDEWYILEIKTSVKRDGNNTNREKIRYKGTFAEILSFVRTNYGSDIQPILATVYSRSHYIPLDGNDDVRVTIDGKVDFFLFENETLVAKHIGSESGFVRVEVKSEKAISDKALFPEGLMRYPVISKGLNGFNFINNYREANGVDNIHKELPNMEIEAKLTTTNDSQILNMIKDLFDKGVGCFKTNPSYPWTIDSASFNSYILDPIDGNIYRAAMSDSRVKLTCKNEGDFIENSKGFKCILKRDEVKGQWRSVWDTPVLKRSITGEFLRIRRAFWVRNCYTQRLYHISYDQSCRFKGKELRQLEIEYIGRIGVMENIAIDEIEREVIEDIAFMVDTLLKKFKTLKQSKTRKLSFFLSEKVDKTTNHKQKNKI